VELLHTLDALFFQVAEARDGWMVKFHGGEPERSPSELRHELQQRGLDVARLEAEGRFSFRPEIDPRQGRAALLRELPTEGGVGDRTIWVSFDWSQPVDLALVIEQQAAMAAMVGAERLVVKTAVLDELADDWPARSRRQLWELHGGFIELSEASVSFSRRTALPPPPAG
jgi:hypothetical protein